MNKSASIYYAACLSSLSFSAFTTASVLESTDVGFSGYLKADAIVSDYSDGTLGSGNVGRDFYIPGLTPVGGVKENAQFDAHIRQSRFRFTTNTALSSGDKLVGVLEFDFQTTPDGNERVSNSYEPRIRHAYIQYNNWLIGQTWSTFQDVKALPETLDFIGATDGTIFGRQTMVRYSNKGFAIALENPESTITPFGGGARIVSDDSTVPDLAASYTMKQDWGYVQVSGLLRELSYVDQQNGADIDTSTASYGISLTGKVMLGQDDIRFMLNSGKGLGRYIGLNTVNGAVLDSNNKLQTIDVTGIAVAYRHLWNEQWRSNLTYSALDADNDVSLTGVNTTQKTSSVRLNLLYSPTKELTFGGEYSKATRELESGADGDMDRLQFSAMYSF
ncbi:MAG: DcaP family trimeric outer membrane transporter [Paraglaciecola sp.]|uniref:DcaP family trimeric outer membrane transporter n=1 Tax=Pseudomonadati TaxID=3379134 RepID=UPI00273CFBCE|nr:DcaP family trimeric outer membrane transporter [Paraglaciecola sp.]MDP5030122.1 DcaP family trimeric outer membrane transporter [Paraglaciecola sp.]MDP5130465.1 DcaP family trimeric outer membrane transporter [Paraglaciecola sp.]